MNQGFYRYPGFLGGVGKEHRDVDGFDEAAKGVYGDKEEDIFLLCRVVKPKRRAEERHNVRKRLKPFRCLLLPNPIERWPASISYNLNITQLYIKENIVDVRRHVLCSFLTY